MHQLRNDELPVVVSICVQKCHCCALIKLWFRLLSHVDYNHYIIIIIILFVYVVVVVDAATENNSHRMALATVSPIRISNWNPWAQRTPTFTKIAEVEPTPNMKRDIRFSIRNGAAVAGDGRGNENVTRIRRVAYLTFKLTTIFIALNNMVFCLLGRSLSHSLRLCFTERGPSVG